MKIYLAAFKIVNLLEHDYIVRCEGSNTSFKLSGAFVFVHGGFVHWRHLSSGAFVFVHGGFGCVHWGFS